MYIYFILHLHTIYTLISVTLLQNVQNGENIQKAQTYLFYFCLTQIYRIFPESAQVTN